MCARLVEHYVGCIPSRRRIRLRSFCTLVAIPWCFVRSWAADDEVRREVRMANLDASRLRRSGTAYRTSVGWPAMQQPVDYRLITRKRPLDCGASRDFTPEVCDTCAAIHKKEARIVGKIVEEGIGAAFALKA